MLTIFSSNSLEQLADQLASQQVAAHQSGNLHPLQNTTLIVPTLAHNRWVRQALAKRLGASASLKAMFPAQFIWQLTVAQLAHVPGVERAAPVPGEQLRWWVYDWLTHVAQRERVVPEAATAILHGLVQNEAERFKLAHRLAKLLGDYWVYRPEWLIAWQEGRRTPYEPSSVHTEWQRALWKFVAEKTGLVGKRHPFQLLAKQLLDAHDNATLALPPRIVLFAINSLAPLYLQVFAELAKYTEVEHYLLSPSEEYWGDVQDARAAYRHVSLSAVDEDSVRDEALAGFELADAGDLLNEASPPLLASWGKNARDFHAALIALTDAPHVIEQPLFGNQAGIQSQHTVLGRLKQEWLTLQVQSDWASDVSDNSIRIHGCSGLQRQVEVLLDELAHAFADDASLKPEDVVVFATDIEQAAPYIHAVFGAHADRPLPYRITGLPDRATQGYALALHSLLQMGEGREASSLIRFEVNAVLRWLRCAPVSAHFGFTVSSLELIARWLRKLNVRNGYGDEASTLALSAAHSWRTGVSQLRALFESQLAATASLTQADVPDAASSVNNFLPTQMSASEGLILLARLEQALEVLVRLRDSLTAPRNLIAWQAQLHLLLDDSFAACDDVAARWLLDTREAINALSLNMPRAMQSMPLSVAVIKPLMSQALQARVPGAVPSGAVTFAELGEFRGLPYRHVAIIGIAQDSFASRDERSEFDLIALAPRKGDRARERDETGALMDALLAAQERVSLYAQTRDAMTNAELPLPAAVDALLSQLKSRTQQDKATQWFVSHALQCYSEQNFNSEKPSYSYEYNAFCEHKMLDNNSNLLLVYDIYAASSERAESAPADIEAYAAYLADPAALQLKQRYNISFKDDDDALGDEEPSKLVGLEAWQLSKLLIERDGLRIDAHSAELQAALPPGAAGEWVLQDFQEKLRPYVQADTKLNSLRYAHEPDANDDKASLFRAEFREMKLRDMARLGLMQAQRAKSQLAPRDAIMLSKDQVMVMQSIPADLAAQLMQHWQLAWQRDARFAPWLPTATTWAYLEAQCKVSSFSGKQSSKSPDEAASEAWDNEREHGLWRCLLSENYRVALSELQGWKAELERCFMPLVPYTKIYTLTGWLKQADVTQGEVSADE